ncbi:MAG: hypothetical protein EXR79_03515 [Myxococcales bacterium]|nr:hypothetical protein [Myxococcales bacterium]
MSERNTTMLQATRSIPDRAAVRRIALICLAAALGCAEQEQPTEGATEVDAAGIDGAVVADAAGAGDSAPATADAAAPTGDAAAAGDASPAEVAGGLICPGTAGDAGCPCTSTSQCASGFCIATPKGQLCAATCSGNCIPGFKCVTATSPGGDTSNICVPQFGQVCDPCAENATCTSVGNADAKCIDFGNAGAFCGTPCNADAECPLSHECKDVKDITGAPAKQCVPKAAATCTCSEAAIKKQLATTCQAVTGDSKCEGKRTCLPAGLANAPQGGGLSACLAPAPKAEECNGGDDDCDGAIDEATCDDGKICTNDKCAGKDGCKNLSNTLSCDADGSVCTEKDQCADSKCVPGKAKTCDDQNPCTTDSCDAKTGCVFANDDGAPCNADDNLCTQKDACKDGNCNPGKTKACASDDGCVVGKCNIVSGACDYKPLLGAPCSDGNPCTTAETCQTDLCSKGQLLDCNDKNTCTTDSCDPKSGCLHSPVAGACNDNDACTQADNCLAGQCAGKAIDVLKECDDSNACTTDLCDAVTGCTHKAASGGKCDDGNPCTDGDLCNGGKCAAEVNKCGCNGDADCAANEDGNQCNGTLFCDKANLPFQCKVKESTVVKCDDAQSGACQTLACDPALGKCKLTKKPEGLQCDSDGDLCTVGDACKDGTCVAGVAQQCDDKNACTEDFCDKKAGCKFTPNTLPCNADDNPCSENDLCTAGTCVVGKPKACATDDPCVDGKCSPVSGKCAYPIKDGAPCNDGTPCTINDLCKKEGDVAKCSGELANCDDKSPCTSDACDSKTGCTHKPVAGTCDDNDKCTASDACKDGACVGAAIDVKVKCDDDSACTNDTCDVGAGCLHKAISGPCDDGNTCTDGDTCQNGKCVAGSSTCTCNASADCLDDGNLCNGAMFCDKTKLPFTCKVNPATVVSCDETQNGPCQSIGCNAATGKCKLSKQPDGLACDGDGNLCTVADTCLGGACIVGKVELCDDKNACTNDACEAKAGCKYTPNTTPCNADDNACTPNDACAQGSCVADKQKACEDKETCTQDTCDIATGSCKYVPLVKSCTDDNVCTAGDACADQPKSGTYTCVAGKVVNCDDQNPCTADSCDPIKGCINTIDTNVKALCYTGEPKTRGKGTCKDGLTVCSPEGKPGECKGQVLPAAKELCDGVDDTCDGVTDEGCAPIAFQARMMTTSMNGAGKTYGTRLWLGASNASGPTAGKQPTQADLGFLAWLKKVAGL